jgi:hypothetical protein
VASTYAVGERGNTLTKDLDARRHHITRRAQLHRLKKLRLVDGLLVQARGAGVSWSAYKGLLLVRALRTSHRHVGLQILRAHAHSIRSHLQHVFVHGFAAQTGRRCPHHHTPYIGVQKLAADEVCTQRQAVSLHVGIIITKQRMFVVLTSLQPLIKQHNYTMCAS